MHFLWAFSKINLFFATFVVLWLKHSFIAFRVISAFLKVTTATVSIFTAIVKKPKVAVATAKR